MARLRFWVLLFALAATAAVVYWRTKPPEKPDAPSVLAQVQQLSQLTTVRYTVQRIVTLTEQKHP